MKNTIILVLLMLVFGCGENPNTNSPSLSEHLKINTENDKWQTHRLNTNSVPTISLEEIEAIPTINSKDYFLLIKEIGKLKINKPKLQEFMKQDTLENLTYEYNQKIEKKDYIFKESSSYQIRDKKQPIGDCRIKKEPICYDVDNEELNIQPERIYIGNNFKEEEAFKKYHSKIIKELEKELPNDGTLAYKGSENYPDFWIWDRDTASNNFVSYDKVFKVPLKQDKIVSLKDNLKIVKIFSVNLYRNYEEDLIYEKSSERDVPYAELSNCLRKPDYCNNKYPLDHSYYMVLRAYNPTLFFINEITNEIIWRY